MAMKIGRRGLVGAVGASALGPVAGHAQGNPKAPKLGIVYAGPQEAVATRVDAIVGGLRASGYPVSQLELVVRAAESNPSQIAPLIVEVLGKQVAALVVTGSAVVETARVATKDVSIIAIDLESDPVASGIAASLARPGGNVTGVFLDFPDFATKLIEMLIESAPKLARIAVVWDPATASVQIEAVRKTAAKLKLQADVLEVRVRGDFDGVFAQASQFGADAVLLLSSPLISAELKTIADLALIRRLPTMTIFPDFARTGGLLAYGPNLLDMYRQVGVLAGKVLRGRDPADLPIERPTRFEMVLNLRTAQALGLSIPHSILSRADEVIE